MDTNYEFLVTPADHDTGPVLLGLPPNLETGTSVKSNSWKELPRHRDEEQVELDVRRAFVYYPERKAI